jgi:hypothetical protein
MAPSSSWTLAPVKWCESSVLVGTRTQSRAWRSQQMGCDWCQVGARACMHTCVVVCLVGVGLNQEEEWWALLSVCLALFRGSGLSREWVRSLASIFRMVLPVYVQAKAVRDGAQWRLLRLTTPFGECAPCDNHSSFSVVIYCLVAHSTFRCVSIHAWTASGRRSFV